MIDPITLLILICLLILSALFSGLNLGLYSLNQTDLERKTELGNTLAARVLRVRKRGNLLLVSLLLGNVAVNSVIAILLGDLTSGVIAAIVTTGLIVIFGEIIPQASCARYALQIGARTAWMVEVTMVILYPIAKPIAWMLDKMLGEELKTIWSKQELEHIISMHEDDPSAVVDADEERILLGALRFSEKTAEQIMTAREVVFTLSLGDTVGDRLVHQIREQGYTRIPIFSEEEDTIVGILLAKDLLGLEGSRPVEDLMRTDKLVRVTPTRKLDEVLNLMISRHAHMALVTLKNGKFIGVVTLEDVLEEIIGREIHDEDDEARTQ
jgi:metal transporter CNNM